MKKKGLVLAIVIAMLTSIIPSFAFATENNSSDEAITKAKKNIYRQKQNTNWDL